MSRPPSDWITLAEAVQILGDANVRLRPETIGRWAREGRLQTLKLGGRRTYRRPPSLSVWRRPSRAHLPMVSGRRRTFASPRIWTASASVIQSEGGRLIEVSSIRVGCGWLHRRPRLAP